MDEDTIQQIYDRVFEVAVKEAVKFGPVAVAATLLGIAMRMYRTAMTKEEFDEIINWVNESVDEVEPYIGDFNDHGAGGQTFH
jgi:hypothetical protein